MKTIEKSPLFTEITTEEAAAVNGGGYWVWNIFYGWVYVWEWNGFFWY